MVDGPLVSPNAKQVAWVKTAVDAKHDGYQAYITTDIVTGKSKSLAKGTHWFWWQMVVLLSIWSPLSPCYNKKPPPLNSFGHVSASHCFCKKRQALSPHQLSRRGDGSWLVTK